MGLGLLCNILPPSNLIMVFGVLRQLTTAKPAAAHGRYSSHPSAAQRRHTGLLLECIGTALSNRRRRVGRPSCAAKELYRPPNQPRMMQASPASCHTIRAVANGHVYTHTFPSLTHPSTAPHPPFPASLASGHHSLQPHTTVDQPDPLTMLTRWPTC
jgi:hypothetical protein